MPKLLRTFIALTLGATALGLPLTHAGEPWPIKRFVVEQTEERYAAGLLKDWIVDNTNSRFATLEQRLRHELFGDDIELTDPQVTEIETYLARVAQQYEDWGLPPPALKPIVETEGGQPAYLVFVYDWGEGRNGVAHTSTLCPTNPNNPLFMAFNTRNEKFYRNGALTEEAYQDLAHELFHAVHNNSAQSRDQCRRFGNNGVGPWFSEGAAEAIGIDTARLLRGSEAYSGNAYRWGLRGYFRDLQNVDKPVGYATHGLWRYLAEARHTLATQGDIRPAATFTETDYSYLEPFLKEKLPGAIGDRDSELEWFDNASKAVFGVRSHVMLRNFYPTLAGYAKERGTTADRAASEAQWLEHLFGSCREHVLTDAKPYSIALVRHQRISAKCLRIRPDVADHADIAITQQGENGSYFRALSIGRLGGAQVGRGNVVELDQTGTGIDSQHPGQQLVTWKFRLPGGESHALILVNVSDVTSATRTHEGRFRIEMASLGSSLAQASPEQSTPGSAGQTPAPGNSASRQAIEGAARDIQSGAVALSNHVSAWSSTHRNPRSGNCQPGLAAANLCGSTIGISLELAPGMMGDTSLTTGAGGGLGQFFSMMQGIAAAGPAEVSAQWQASAERARDQTGSSVSMTLPLIDYGFTGTISNAQILVNRAGGGDPYRSVTPSTRIIDGTPVHAPNGRVTIEEYSPVVMRGSYSATLVDAKDWNGEGPLPVFGQVSGRFNVLDAWSGDERYAVAQPADPTESAMEDMRQVLPGLSGVLTNSLQVPTGSQNGSPSGGANAGGSGGSASGGSGVHTQQPACDCRCETIKQLEDACKFQCLAQIMRCMSGEGG